MKIRLSEEMLEKKSRKEKRKKIIKLTQIQSQNRNDFQLI